jgi:hypothetical protein
MINSTFENNIYFELIFADKEFENILSIRDANPFWSLSWRKFFNGEPNDNFQKIFIIRLKAKGETKGKIFNQQL